MNWSFLMNTKFTKQPSLPGEFSGQICFDLTHKSNQPNAFQSGIAFCLH